MIPIANLVEDVAISAVVALVPGSGASLDFTDDPDLPSACHFPSKPDATSKSPSHHGH